MLTEKEKLRCQVDLTQKMSEEQSPGDFSLPLGSAAGMLGEVRLPAGVPGVR